MRLFPCIVPLLVLTGCQQSTPLATSEPAHSPQSVVPSQPAVQNDFADLSSVTFVVTGGFAGINDTLDITEGHIKQLKNRPISTTDAVFTKADMKQLAAVLYDADFTHLVGDYRQKNLADGFNETLTVMVGTGRGSKVYVVRNYGDQAPPAYHKVAAYLRQLEKSKLAQPK